MNLKLLIPAGLLALLVGLVIYLPAPVVAGWVQARVPGLTLTGVSGNLFSGRLQYVGYRDVNLENIDWSIAGWPLLVGRADLNLTLPTDTGRLSGDVSQGLFSDLHIDNLSGSASLAWLAGLAGYRFVPLDGQLRVDDLRATVEGRELTDVAGQLGVLNANWLLFKPPLVFGDYRAELASTEQGHGLRIVDSQGQLKVEGQAQLLNANAYNVDMRVRARTGADERLTKLLRQLGRPDAQGWYRIRERGSF